MGTPKSHADHSYCPIAHALDIVGDRWTLLVLRDVMFMGQHEFSEILKMPERIATNILTSRLKKLVKSRLLDSIPHPSNKTKKLYYLTDKGIDLIPMMMEMVLWALRNIPEIPDHHPKIKMLKENPQEIMKKAIADAHEWRANYGV